MARVTVEDCIEKVDDQFELVVLAAQRAKNVAAGSALTLERKNEKNTVLSLREIAAGNVEPDDLRDDLTKGFMQRRDMDEDVREDLEELAYKSPVAAIEEETTEEVLADDTAAKELAADDSGFSFDEDNLDVED